MRSIQSFVLAVALVGCGTSEVSTTPDTLGEAEQPLGPGVQVRRLAMSFSLHGTLVQTADPCVAHAFENGTATSPQLGTFTFAGVGVDNFCTRGQGEGDFTSITTLTAPNGDKLFARYQTPFSFNGTSVTWPGGTWTFLGGTGKFAGIRGLGTVGASGIPDVTQTTPYPCNFDGVYAL